MNPADKRVPNEPPSGTARKRSRLPARVLAVVALLAGGAGAYVWWRLPVADLPVIDWSQADPAVVEVVEAARAAVRQSPRSGAAWGKLGMTLFAHYLVPEAQVCFVQAQRFEPNEPRWPYYLAEILRRSDPDAAIPPLRRAVELAGASIEPRLPLAYLLLAQGHLGEAEAEFRRVLEGEPDNAWALQGLGQTMREQGQDAECRALLQRTAANPATAKPIDPWTEAIWELQVGRKAMLKRAETLLQQRQIPRALALLEKTARAYPDSAEVWLRLGQALNQVSDLPAAERALNRAVEAEPNSSDAQLALGLVLYRQNKHTPAVACFRKAVTLRPDYALAHFDLSLVLQSLGDRIGAIEALRAAVRLRPNFADAHLNLADLLAEEGENAEARSHAQIALELSPANERGRALLEKLKP